MSAISTALASSSLGSALPAGSLPAIDPALEPASVRNGDQAAKNAYQTGLAFEDVLSNELAQALSSTVPGLTDDGLGGSTADSSDATDSSGGGLTGSDSGLGAYSSLLPQTMATSLMSAGGTGVAMEIAQAIDPALAGARS